MTIAPSRVMFPGTAGQVDHDAVDHDCSRGRPMTKPLSRREREQARHRREILDAAEHLFAEHGFHETTMQMIAERAEFSVGYLYKHFEGKEEIHRQMVAFHLARLDELIAEVDVLELPPLEDLHRSYQEICRHFNDHRDFMRIFHDQIAGPTEQLMRQKDEHFQKLVSRLEAAVAAGAIRSCDTELLAAAIQGATKELFVLMADRPGDRPFDFLPDILFSLLIDPLRT
jgi:AcrR family transcriptional regulator